MAEVQNIEIKNELRLYSYFQSLDDTSVQVFADHVVITDFKAGQNLLEQGDLNESLYFLRKGTVAIFVDTEKVNELSAPGEMIGEMSLIELKPVHATVKALSPVSTYCISKEKLETLGLLQKQELCNIIYKVYAGILVQRLAKTNEKAKRFEIANREMQIAQKNLHEVHEKLENEIARRTQEIVEKVRELTASHLLPLIQSMSQQKENTQPWIQSVSEVIDFLKPVFEVGIKEQKIQAKSVLLVDSNKKLQNIARLALGGTGISLSLAANWEELEQKLNGTQYDLILCDYQLRDLLFGIKAKSPSTPLVFLLPEDFQVFLDALKEFPDQPFLVSRDIENRALTIKNISTTVTKILNHEVFGMEKYLSWGSRVVEQKVLGSALRAPAIEVMKDHLKAFGIRTTILDKVHTVSEELLMNAIYDAPLGVDGKPLYNHLARNCQVNLTEEQAATLKYGTDGVLLAISVSDPFGGLRRETISNYLGKGLAGVDVQSPDKGGAGKGLLIMIQTSDLTIINVRRGKRTEVICLFLLEKPKDFETKPTLHLFFE